MNDTARLTALADETLLTIRSRPGRARTLSSLARRFEVSEQDISAALNMLTEWDYRLRRTAAEVTFVEAPDLLTATEIGYRLKTKTIGHTVHAYRSVKSTNDIAAQLATGGAAEGTIVTAENQTKGRGRLNRSWHSPMGAGIYVSIILRPRFSAERAPGLSVMTALALAETIETYCPGRTRIKWPNDVLVSNRKLAGILTELAADRQRIDHVILGVGINVNQRAVDFPEDLRSHATSLRRAARRQPSRVELLKSFLLRLEKEYGIYQKRGLRPGRTRLRRFSSLLGRRLRLARGREMIEGTAVDIGSDGSLILDTAEGAMTLTSGEVTVVNE